MNKEKAIQWMVGDDTGTSSKTMFAALMGVDRYIYCHDVPYDIDDFGRCYRFAKYAELTSEDLQKVKEVFPYYTPIIDNWDKLCDLYNSGDSFYEYISS